MREFPPFGEIFGIFARTFWGSTLGIVLDQVELHKIRQIQLNLASAGVETLPATLSEQRSAEIARAIRDRGLTLAAISGTFNLIDPNCERRAENLRRLGVLASACRHLDTRVVTLCTGTRDTESMWRGHPENDTPEAWAELVESMREVARIADRHEVTMAFEPEQANVVNSATKARRLLDEIRSPWLKVVFDPANLIPADRIRRMHRTIDEAFALLGGDIALVHAKELARDGTAGDLAPGEGVMDFCHVFRHYHRLKLDVPVIMHGLPERDVEDGKNHLLHERGCAIGGRVLTIRGKRDSEIEDIMADIRDLMPDKWRATHDKDSVSFNYLDIGGGLPFVFQHGLGGDVTKMEALIKPKDGVRLITFDARYHGRTRPFASPEKIGFDQSADDLLALLDHRGIAKAVIGGLSMGAGIALNFALRYPDRMRALILSRPAWLDEPLPENVRMFPEMAALIRELGPKAARVAFENTETYRNILAQSTDSASAMLGMFDDPICEEAVDRFEWIPGDCPSRDRAAWRSIGVPTLVLANHQDPIHPFAMGEELASLIPGAELRVLTPKCVDMARHEAEFNEYVGQFLDKHFASVIAG